MRYPLFSMIKQGCRGHVFARSGGAPRNPMEWKHDTNQFEGESEMKRVACMFGVLALVIAGALVTGQAGAGDEAASIKDLMGKLHKGAKAPVNQLKAQFKSDSPDWAKIKTDAKEIDSLSGRAEQVRSAQGRCVGLQGPRRELPQERRGPGRRRGERGPGGRQGGVHEVVDLLQGMSLRAQETVTGRGGSAIRASGPPPSPSVAEPPTTDRPGRKPLDPGGAERVYS